MASPLATAKVRVTPTTDGSSKWVVRYGKSGELANRSTCEKPCRILSRAAMSSSYRKLVDHFLHLGEGAWPTFIVDVVEGIATEAKGFEHDPLIAVALIWVHQYGEEVCDSLLSRSTGLSPEAS